MTSFVSFVDSHVPEGHLRKRLCQYVLAFYGNLWCSRVHRGYEDKVKGERLKDNRFALLGFLSFFLCPLAFILFLINLSRQRRQEGQRESKGAKGYEGPI
jgi:hypothetical protein